MPNERPPAEVQLQIDRVIAELDLRDVVNQGPSFVDLVDWCAKNLIASYEADFVAINGRFKEEFPTDEQLLDHDVVEEVDQITDSLRVQHLREHFRSIFEGEYDPDIDFHPLCTCMDIVSSSGVPAVIAVGTRGYSFTEVTEEWFGVFRDRSTFRRWMRDRGYLTKLADFDALAFKEQIALWAVDEEEADDGAQINGQR